MKKLLSIFMVVAMMATLSMTALAAGEITAADGSSGTDVKAKYNVAVAEDVYSVDIIWGDMEFDYTAAGQKWDSVNHQWVDDDQAPATWAVKSGSDNTITLLNHSSVKVSAGFAFGATVDGIAGAFTYNAAALTEALELPVAAADTAAVKYVVSFLPTSGDIDESFTEYSKIGAITITLGTVVSE